MVSPLCRRAPLRRFGITSDFTLTAINFGFGDCSVSRKTAGLGECNSFRPILFFDSCPPNDIRVSRMCRWIRANFQLVTENGQRCESDVSFDRRRGECAADRLDLLDLKAR
jgi:hypothetical protein